MMGAAARKFIFKSISSVLSWQGGVTQVGPESHYAVSSEVAILPLLYSPTYKFTLYTFSLLLFINIHSPTYKYTCSIYTHLVTNNLVMFVVQ